MRASNPMKQALGEIPNRLQLAGGWIDQPFISRHNPKPPGSMVAVQIEPDFRPMDRSGNALRHQSNWAVSSTANGV
ncbi:MAG: hypothetical protein WCI03_14350 [bacterium]|jgi:hypothetical protein